MSSTAFQVWHIYLFSFEVNGIFIQAQRMQQTFNSGRFITLQSQITHSRWETEHGFKWGQYPALRVANPWARTRYIYQWDHQFHIALGSRTKLQQKKNPSKEDPDPHLHQLTQQLPLTEWRGVRQSFSPYFLLASGITMFGLTGRQCIAVSYTHLTLPTKRIV